MKQRAELGWLMNHGFPKMMKLEHEKKGKLPPITRRLNLLITEKIEKAIWLTEEGTLHINQILGGSLDFFVNTSAAAQAGAKVEDRRISFYNSSLKGELPKFGKGEKCENLSDFTKHFLSLHKVGLWA
jgi:hypothetical protein